MDLHGFTIFLICLFISSLLCPFNYLSSYCTFIWLSQDAKPKHHYHGFTQFDYMFHLHALVSWQFWWEMVGVIPRYTLIHAGTVWGDNDRSRHPFKRKALAWGDQAAEHPNYEKLRVSTHTWHVFLSVCVVLFIHVLAFCMQERTKLNIEHAYAILLY